VPRWVVTCPECGHTFTHTKIDRVMMDDASHDPFGIVPRPKRVEKRTCPKCQTESEFNPFRLFYREDAP
jgi:endogenous inhibitor of DNA gyrase (YacG/DUF329 family)